ncbi:MAG: hydantoinase B/oxoprolinase family protein [Pseudomonadota bacterium]
MATVMKEGSATDFDPITFSVIRNRFEAIGQEMTLAMEQTAWTSVIALARDYSCMIYDAHESGPRQVTMAECLPIHCNSIRELLVEVVNVFQGDIHDGDVFMANDPYRGNTHIPDLVTAQPVFVDGKHVFWTVARGHQLDCGAAEASSIVPAARTIFQEGIVIPPTKLIDQGKERHDITELYLANVRYRDALHGDLRAQLGACGVARRGLIELCEQYGRDEVVRYSDGLMEYADHRASEQFHSIPDGTYEGLTWTDTDGNGAVDIPIKATITKKGTSVSVMYSGGPPSTGSFNATHAVRMATATTPFLYYIDADIPHNHGVLQHIKADGEPGTITKAEFPAAVGGATTNPADPMHDVINIAMAEAIPERVPAGSCHAGHMPNFSGIDNRNGKEWGCMLFNGMGGSGGAKDADGWPMIGTIAGMGGLTSASVEEVELLYPLRIDFNEIETDSMGAGQWIGGAGTRTRYRPVAGEMEAVGFGEGSRNPPHGVNGGRMSPGGGIFIEHEDGARTYISVAGQTMVKPGESWTAYSSGGGGWGNPVDRDAEVVRANIRDGWFSEAKGREEFGVVLNDDLERTVDVGATEKKRAELRAQEAGMIDPVEPGAGKWVDCNMRDGDRYIEAPTIAEHFSEEG